MVSDVVNKTRTCIIGGKMEWFGIRNILQTPVIK